MAGRASATASSRSRRLGARKWLSGYGGDAHGGGGGDGSRGRMSACGVARVCTLGGSSTSEAARGSGDTCFTDVCLVRCPLLEPFLLSEKVNRARTTP